MSRIANSPIELPDDVDIKLEGQQLTVKGKKGTLSLDVNPSTGISISENVVVFRSKDPGNKKSIALTGTTRALVNNMVLGVSKGFEKKLVLNGVGYRAKATGNKIVLVLGYSHDVDYVLPEEVTAETPSQTEIVLSSSNKQLLGQVAADIRELRPPEPYKGKGVRYADEHIRRKEAKKK